MANTLDQLDPRDALVKIAADFHHRGWMAGTAGNLSIRDEEDAFWVTSSGLPKGCLDNHDLIQVNIADGEVKRRLRENSKPSAETSIHQVVYQLFPEAKACFHVHTVDACIATSRIPKESSEMELPPLEMIKGFDIWEQEPEVHLPLFENILDVSVIADQIHSRFSQTPPQIPALMICNHGVTVWGNSAQQAYNRVEIIEFIMSYMARSTTP